MQILKGILKSQTTYWIGFSLLIIYVGLRAALVDMTHDEAWSFHNVKNFWYVEFLCTGNSHWINSSAMKISILLGCENVFCLRWFSVLSFIITCCFGFWWIKSFIYGSTRLLGFCLLFLNPYLIDYFGLARGYAGGVMFQCAALWLFINGISSNKRIPLFAALFFSCISAIANYSFVYFSFAFGIIYFYKIYFSKGKLFLKNKNFYIDSAFCLCVALLIIRAIIFMMRCSGDFRGAGEPSFLSMFHVFSDGLLYYKITLPKLVLFAFSLAIFIFVSSACYFGITGKNKHRNQLYYYVSLLLSIMIINMVINYFCFQVPYPFYRAAQLLFVPTFISVTCFIDFYLYKITKPIVITVVILLIINFISCINFKYVFDFKEQADAELCFNKLEKLNAKHIGISPELYGVFVNYYQSSTTKKHSYIGDRIETRYPKGLCNIKNKLAEFDYLILYPPYDLSYYINSNVHLTNVYVSPTTKNLILQVQKSPD